jgi:LysM repeat protein
MVLKRMIPLLVIVLTLAGCFRQADEPFDTVNSQNAPAQIIDATETQEITIIDPNATDVLPVTADSQQVEKETTATVVIINPVPTKVEAATETIILPATSVPLTIPTATEASFITPEAPIEVELPTTVPTEEVEEPTLVPTPTAFGDEEEAVIATECQYIVESGDNLFRIAINNQVSLAALLAENGLTEASIIQPGQIIHLPNCEDGEIIDSPQEEETITSTPEALDDCQYTIQANDTLFAIAIRNVVTLADLLELNDLTETTIIQPGDILQIPNCDDSESSLAPGAEETETVSNVTIHTVTAEDTLLSIAQLYGVTVNDIIQANSIPDPNNLSLGQQLLIPELEN